MANWSNFYLIRIDFLGFRYHGWQNQPGLKTIQSMIEKTIPYVLGHKEFKVLGCGRTDAKVSAHDFAFELFVNEEIDQDKFLADFNKNLPSDIRGKSIKEVDASFNIIQHSKIKEYHYMFSHGSKTHPFNAPFIHYLDFELNVEDMKEAAKEFEGIHNFRRYTSKPNEHTILEREIISSEIVVNNSLFGSFVPENSFIFKVKSRGFLRYQVRLMMAALIDVGKGEWLVEELKESLENPGGEQIRHIAPSSALHLHKISFE